MILTAQKCNSQMNNIIKRTQVKKCTFTYMHARKPLLFLELWDKSLCFLHHITGTYSWLDYYTYINTLIWLYLTWPIAWPWNICRSRSVNRVKVNASKGARDRKMKQKKSNKLKKINQKAISKNNFDKSLKF